jgi:hypothetical protein
MDANRFDALARSLIVTVSRRAAFSGLIAGLIAPLLVDPAAAKRRKRRGRTDHAGRDADRAGGARVGIEKKKPKKKKKKNPTPCAATCTGKPPCADDGCGDPCETCAGAGQTCGGGGTPGVCGCIPLNACPIGQNCGTVPDGCGGTLACGTCTAPQTCGGGGSPGVCGSAGCVPSCQDDNGTSRNCGDDGCGGSCGDCLSFGVGGVCNSNGHCTCLEGYRGCGSDCADILTDERHCGRCDQPCPGGNCCSGFCTDPLYSPGACGGCGNVCPMGHATCCNGQCVNLLDNPAHCGNCARFGGECPQGWGCVGGQCRPAG